MEKKQIWKSRLPVIILLLIMLAGICMIFYPLVSNLLYEKDSSIVTTKYEDTVEDLEDEETETMLAEAKEYNQSLLNANIVLTDPFDPALLEKQGSVPYMSVLNYAEGGIMGYLEIPILSVNYPIYHGTTTEVLEKGIGHLEQTSLPIGGESTHSVLTGHSGLAGKRMLTDLQEMEVGDVFYIHMMKDILAYEVVERSIVKPEDTERLAIQREEDLVTLVTCYPYGINSHRLLVTGKRTEYVGAAEQEKAQQREVKSVWQEHYKKGVLICIAVYLPLIIVSIILIRRWREK